MTQMNITQEQYENAIQSAQVHILRIVADRLAREDEIALPGTPSEGYVASAKYVRGFADHVGGIK